MGAGLAARRWVMGWNLGRYVGRNCGCGAPTLHRCHPAQGDLGGPKSGEAAEAAEEGMATPTHNPLPHKVTPTRHLLAPTHRATWAGPSRARPMSCRRRT